MTAGTLVIDGYGGTSTGATFNVSPGAQVDIDGNETWGGTITGSGGGSVVIDSDAFTSINADGATFNFPTGMLNWVTGTITGTFTNLGDLTISSTANNTVNASNTLDNSGTIEINGQLNLGNLNNQAGGTITLEGSAVISGGNSSTFNNQGTLDKVGAGTASINVGNFNNLAAPIKVSAGTLVDNSGGTSTGATFTVAAGAEVDLTYTSSWTGNYAGSGGGNVVLEPVTFANLTFNGATLNFPAGMLEWPTGTLAGNFTNLGSVIIPGTGSVTLNGSLTNQGTIDLAGDSSINGGASQLLVNAGLLEKTAGTGLAAINVSFNNQGATMEVDSGTLSLAGGGTDSGGTFDVAAGATLDLTGNSEPTLTGTYTGSGGGTVVLSGGVVFIGIGGATLNFPAGMLQWTGTLISSALGDLTNLGTMTLAGSSDHGFIQGGTLYDFGSIIQAGSGNLALHATTLQVEPGASYLIEADSGIDIPEMGTSALINQGTIEKTGGTGTSTILIDGTIDNSGTIEAASGTLALSGSIAQVSNGTLTAGTWDATGGATLSFPTGTNITDNEANVTIDGQGAAIAGIQGLSTNGGTLAVSDGASFSAAGGLSNTGSLTLGPGSTLTVQGNYTQSSSATLSDQIGGTPASGLFGELNATGAATLAGVFGVSLVNDFGPSSGQTFDVMSFASASGSFTGFNGLNPFFTESLSSIGLDIEDAATQAVDLAATSVTAPTTADVGQSITVNWQATDESSQATTGSWQDSVYISPTPTITSSSTLLGMVPENLTLAGEASYNASLTATLPANLAPGYYDVLVQIDSLYQLPDPNRANNIVAATTGQIDISLAALTPGTPYTDAFTAADQDHYYQITVPAGGSLNVSLQSSALSGAVALYISQGTLPTLYNYQEAAATSNQPNQTAVVPQVLTSGTYYVLAHSVSGAAATASFTVTATQTAAVSVSAISPYSGGNAGNVTIEIDGTNFTSAATASLTLGGTTINDSTMDFVNASQMFATFNLAGAAVGEYTLSVQQGAQSVTAPSTFQVVAASPASLNVALVTPQYIRTGRTGTIVITYTNETQNDIVAPLLTISSTNTNVFFSTPDNPNDFVQTAQVLAVAPSGPAGILRPARAGRLPSRSLTTIPRAARFQFR